MPVNSALQLSIILPIYNVEPYVEKCIRSLEEQDIPKDAYEIICVNDGSPDNSQQIVEKLQQEFSNIILINQKNKGVSMARNVAIEKARGKYILFVDPDDALQGNCLGSLLHYAEKDNYEVVYFGMTAVEMDGSTKAVEYIEGLEVAMNGIKLYYEIRKSGSYKNNKGKTLDPDRSWAVLFQKRILIDNNLYYLPKVAYLEDGEFIARVLCLTKRGSIFNQPYYLRLNRPGSATRSDLIKQERTIKGFILAAKNLIAFKNKHPLNVVQKGLINGRVVKFVVLAVHATLKDIQKFRWVKKELKKNNLTYIALENVDPYYTKLGKRYNSSLNWFYLSSNLDIMKRSFKKRFLNLI